MSLVEHLYELRSRITKAALAVVLTTIVGFIWYQHGIFGTLSLGDILKGPYCDLPASSRAQFGPSRSAGTPSGPVLLAAARRGSLHWPYLVVAAIIALNVQPLAVNGALNAATPDNIIRAQLFAGILAIIALFMLPDRVWRGRACDEVGAPPVQVPTHGIRAERSDVAQR